MDDLFDLDDPLDLTSPFGLVLAAAVLLDDDDRHCGCWCGCRRDVEVPDDVCDPCLAGQHRDGP